MANLPGENEIVGFSSLDIDNVRRQDDTNNFAASTVIGTTKELYGYVPSSDLLASVESVAATVKKSSATQHPTFTNIEAFTIHLVEMSARTVSET
tara:strand:+ start:126 stop:410 length:285 start_codon:yes stop_codon:yes gene_type:complete